MGKEKNPRRVADNEAMAKLRMLRTSPQKLDLVAQLIRGKPVDRIRGSHLSFGRARAVMTSPRPARGVSTLRRLSDPGGRSLRISQSAQALVQTQDRSPSQSVPQRTVIDHQ